MSLTIVDYLVATNENWRDSVTLESGDPAGPVDLTGSTFRAHLRQPAEALHTVLVCTTENGRLVIADQEEDTGVLAWNVPVEVLQYIEPGEYAYDVVWTDAEGNIDRFMAGKVTIQRGVTRP